MKERLLRVNYHICPSDVWVLAVSLHWYFPSFWDVRLFFADKTFNICAMMLQHFFCGFRVNHRPAFLQLWDGIEDKMPWARVKVILEHIHMRICIPIYSNMYIKQRQGCFQSLSGYSKTVFVFSVLKRNFLLMLTSPQDPIYVPQWMYVTMSNKFWFPANFF